VTAAAAVTTQFRHHARHSFPALASRNFRTYLAGQSMANTGTWMQSIAQDWLMLELTHSSTAVGVTMALQFLPTLLFGMQGGALADRLPRRRVLLVTQTINALLLLTLAVVTITGLVRPVEVFAFAFASGLVMVIDAPTRQVFVGDVVGADRLRNAVSLTAAVFQTTRLVGPAVAGVLIGTVGSGWVFAINSCLYIAPTITLARIRVSNARPAAPRERPQGSMRATVRHVLDRPQVAWTILLVGVVGTFGLNFPVVLTAMAHSTFAGNASLYGTFNIALAVGSVTGALVAGTRSHSRLRMIVVAGCAFGVAQALAGAAPDLVAFLVLLVAMGALNLAFQAMANASVQLWIDPVMRGRVMGLYLLVFLGGTPLGAPLIGLLTSHFGPRVGMITCGVVPALAALAVGLVHVRTLRLPRPARA
jgi:MFS family permease